MTNFATYEVTPDLDVYNLADGLLFDIAEQAKFEVPSPDERNEHSEAYLEDSLSKVGPDRELQQNISAVRAALGPNSRLVIADWIERSGIMVPVERGFMSETPVPEKFDTLFWSGGVANWMMRRLAMTQRFDPNNVGRVVLPFSTREMKPGEHQLVATYQKEHDGLPTEYDFANRFIKPMLHLVGFAGDQVIIMNTGKSKGDDVLKAAFADEKTDLLSDQIVVVSNAPNAIQAAGQLRFAGKDSDSSFDANNDQLFMVSDSFPLARNGEPTKTHQNPETALGQLYRNALFLERNKPTRASS